MTDGNGRSGDVLTGRLAGDGRRGVGIFLRTAGLRLVMATVFWWLLTEGAGGWLLGGPAVLLAVIASLLLAPAGGRWRLQPLGLLRFGVVFLLRSILAGVQVARLALAPRRALRPAVRALETRLPPGLPRVLLANTLTLQPGTLAVRLDDEHLLLHVLDASQSLEPEVRALEARIADMLGLGGTPVP